MASDRLVLLLRESDDEIIEIRGHQSAMHIGGQRNLHTLFLNKINHIRTDYTKANKHNYALF